MFTSTPAQVPCCVCGIAIDPNPSGMCLDCLRSETNFAQVIPNQLSVIYCRSCGRYQTSATTWQRVELDSPELLQICLKRLTSMREMRIVNAEFLYTEPHARRIRVSLTVQKDAVGGTVLRQTLIITFVVNFIQCPDCQEAATPREHWVSKVQVRHDGASGRTLLWLEQQILSHRALHGATTIERKHGGVDFHFPNKPSGQRFTNFLKTQLPVAVTESAKQVGEDIHSGTLDMRFSFSVRVPPLNRQDLVVLPPRWTRSTGNQSFIAVVYKVGRKIKLIDPVTATMIDIDGPTYWDKPFEPALTVKSMKPFVVIMIDPVGPRLGRFQLADVELTDEETYGERLLVRSHLGAQLKEGAHCCAYDMRACVLPDVVQHIFTKQDLPDVVIAGTGHPTRHRGRRKRVWHLKQLAPRKDDEEEFEEFLDELENDPDLRKDVNIYRNPDLTDDNPDVRASIIGLSEMKIDDGTEPYAFVADA
jgi:nonsense-mediated mRNA decay protein 3